MRRTYEIRFVERRDGRIQNVEVIELSEFQRQLRMAFNTVMKNYAPWHARIGRRWFQRAANAFSSAFYSWFYARLRQNLNTSKTVRPAANNTGHLITDKRANRLERLYSFISANEPIETAFVRRYASAAGINVSYSTLLSDLKLLAELDVVQNMTNDSNEYVWSIK